ncbi:MAG: hypothetical protein QF918_08725, partial [Pirellulaceae bacterium]|nr:hypothetical protein [Pirellulaceae bacterium]
MKSFVQVPILAAIALLVSVNTASAGYLGAASYRHCAATSPASFSCAKQQCYTVMKTCRNVVYEKQQYTCYRTAYETVYDTKT